VVASYRGKPPVSCARPDVVTKAAGTPPAAFVSLSRTIAADTLTPIAAYAGLAQDGAACLLESVESGGRISRYSFIGLDYLDARSFEDDGNVISRVREFVRGYGLDALVAFAYDAARSYARLPLRPPADPPMPAAYVAIPRTWLTFDHFTDSLTITTSASSEDEAQAAIARYVLRLLALRPSLPAAVRAVGPMRASLDR